VLSATDFQLVRQRINRLSTGFSPEAVETGSNLLIYEFTYTKSAGYTP
jgi:hypothetical protein